MPTTTVPLHSPDFYAGDPYPAYRELRNTTPVVWNDVTNFWALLKYEDVRYVSGHPLSFSSTKGITIPDPSQPEPVQEGTSFSPTLRATGSCASSSTPASAAARCSCSSPRCVRS